MEWMYYFTKHFVLLHQSADWEVKDYGHKPSGKGDCIWRTAIAAIAYQHKPFLYRCLHLLSPPEPRRWPIGLDHPNDARNWWEQEWNTLKRKFKRRFGFGLKWKPMYRAANSMTRDPYIMTACACMLIPGCQKYIKDIHVPWYKNRPALHYWLKWLETGDVKYKHKWEWWEEFEFSTKKPFYGTHLDCWQIYVGKSTLLARKLRKKIPHWNLLCRVLLNDYIPNREEKIAGYRPRSGWLWQSPVYEDPDDPKCSVYYLSMKEEYHLDYDVLAQISQTN